LNHYDENKITQTICDSVFNHAYKLQNLPEKCRLPEMYEKYMCVNNIRTLGTYDDKKITQEMCNRVVELRYNNIQNIPEKYRTYEMCNKLVKYHPKFLMYVPTHIQTTSMCFDAISRDFNTIRFVKIDYNKTIKDIVKKKIIENHLNIKYISTHSGNDDLFLFAFELSNGQLVIEHASNNLRDKMRHFCLEKINNDLTNLKSYDGCYKILEHMLP
jgi:hypothetical protein